MLLLTSLLTYVITPNYADFAYTILRMQRHHLTALKKVSKCLVSD